MAFMSVFPEKTWVSAFWALTMFAYVNGCMPCLYDALFLTCTIHKVCRYARAFSFFSAVLNLTIRSKDVMCTYTNNTKLHTWSLECRDLHIFVKSYCFASTDLRDIYCCVADLTVLSPVYTIQPVVKPVVKPIWQQVVSCKRGNTVQTQRLF